MRGRGEQVVQAGLSHLDVGALTFRQHQDVGPAIKVRHHVQLGVQTAACAPDAAVFLLIFAGLFFTPFAATRCVLICVALMMSVEGTAACSTIFAKTCWKMPLPDNTRRSSTRFTPRDLLCGGQVLLQLRELIFSQPENIFPHGKTSPMKTVNHYSLSL